MQIGNPDRKCKRGHSLTEATTNTNGECTECTRIRAAAQYERFKQQKEAYTLAKEINRLKWVLTTVVAPARPDVQQVLVNAVLQLQDMVGDSECDRMIDKYANFDFATKLKPI